MTIAENGIKYESLNVGITFFSGIILDWALAMADPDLLVFSMPEYTYPGNAEKLNYCLNDHAVIVDLMWDLYIEGPKLRGRWNPTKDWGQLGPYLNKYPVSIVQSSSVFSAPIAYMKKREDGVCADTLQATIAKRIVIELLGPTVNVPAPLIERYKQQLENDKHYLKEVTQ